MKRSARGRILRVALAVVAGWLLVGCSSPNLTPNATLPAPTPSVSPTPRLVPGPTPTIGRGSNSENILAGWTEYEEPEGGFALALPPGWRKIEAGKGALAQLQAVGFPSHSQRATPPEPVGSEEPDVRFLAVAGTPDTPGPLLASMNVLSRPLSAGTTLAGFAEANQRALEASPQVGSVEQTAIVLPAGPAIRLHYRLSVTATAEQPLELQLCQFLLVRRSQGYVLTCAALPEAEAHYLPLFAAIADSWRWLEEQ